jgi:acyl-coenzyme A thioesterase PaaI-like protein
MVAPGDGISTVDLRVDYLRPGPLCDLVCEARVVRAGNRVSVTDMNLFGVVDKDQTVATGKGVYNVRRGRVPWEVVK